MLDRTLLKLVFDAHLKKIPREHYEARRKKHPLAIDQILKPVGAQYPPHSTGQLEDLLSKLETRERLSTKRLLVLYLGQDLKDIVPELLLIPNNYDFPRPIIHLGLGLWAVDNDNSSQIVSCLSNPSVVLANYFDQPKELANIIVHALETMKQPRLALMMMRVLQPNLEDAENLEYDHRYATLLVNSGQLAEALRYTRLFSENKRYREILQGFFDLCSDTTKSLLNCLNLSEIEEEIFNQHPEPKARNRMMHNQSYQSDHSKSLRDEDMHHREHEEPLQQIYLQRQHQTVRKVSMTDSPARNTRSARKKKN